MLPVARSPTVPLYQISWLRESASERVLGATPNFQASCSCTRLQWKKGCGIFITPHKSCVIFLALKQRKSCWVRSTQCTSQELKLWTHSIHLWSSPSWGNKLLSPRYSVAAPKKRRTIDKLWLIGKWPPLSGSVDGSHERSNFSAGRRTKADFHGGRFIKIRIGPLLRFAILTTAMSWMNNMCTHHWHLFNWYYYLWNS